MPGAVAADLSAGSAVLFGAYFDWRSSDFRVSTAFSDFRLIFDWFSTDFLLIFEWFSSDFRLSLVYSDAQTSGCSTRLCRMSTEMIDARSRHGVTEIRTVLSQYRISNISIWIYLDLFGLSLEYVDAGTRRSGWSRQGASWAIVFVNYFHFSPTMNSTNCLLCNPSYLVCFGLGHSLLTWMWTMLTQVRCVSIEDPDFLLKNPDLLSGILISYWEMMIL